MKITFYAVASNSKDVVPFSSFGVIDEPGISLYFRIVNFLKKEANHVVDSFRNCLGTLAGRAGQFS
jgi:hypothetical protein